MNSISRYHRCALNPLYTAKERLSNSRHARRMNSDRYARYRTEQERLINRLSKVGGRHRTRGSGYNAETRSDILLSYLDMRKVH